MELFGRCLGHVTDEDVQREYDYFAHLVSIASDDELINRIRQCNLNGDYDSTEVRYAELELQKRGVTVEESEAGCGMERIRSMKHLGQVISTNGLIPTPHAYCGDIDMTVCIGNNTVLIDVKASGASPSTAQAMNYQHICDALAEYGDNAWYLVVHHDCFNGEPIVLDKCKMFMTYHDGEYKYPAGNAGDFIRNIFKEAGIDVYEDAE